jgi:hypothetical protein
MNIVTYQHRTVVLTAKVLSSFPEDLSLDDGGPWLRRAFWLAQLHYHLLKTLPPEKVHVYVNFLLKSKRRVEIDADIYQMLLEAGHNPTFARWWRKLVYPSGYDFLSHAASFREYLPLTRWYLQ